MILKPRHNACFCLTYLILGLLPMNFILGTTEISEKKIYHRDECDELQEQINDIL